MKFFMMLKGTTRFGAFRRSLFVIGISLIIASVDLAYAMETKIAFSSSRDGNNEIYAIATDGANPVRLTKNPAFDIYPARSPEGTKIDFTSLHNLVGEELFLMALDGTNIIQLTHGSEKGMNRMASRAASSIFKRKVGYPMGACQTETVSCCSIHVEVFYGAESTQIHGGLLALHRSTLKPVLGHLNPESRRIARN